MGEIDTAIRYSKEIESLLETRLGAEGRGLHEKASSVEHNLSRDQLKTLRYIATIRNKVVNEADYKIDNYENFVSSFEDALTFLKSAKKPNSENTFSATTSAEERTRQFLLSLAGPAAILFAVVGGG